MQTGSTFPGRLRELREAAGLTQGQLAEKAGMTREGIAQLEVGRRSPAWESVVALCRALGVDCNAFMQEPGEQAPRGPGRPPKEKPEAPAPAKVGKRVKAAPRPAIQPGRSMQEASDAAAQADRSAGGRGRAKKKGG